MFYCGAGVAPSLLQSLTGFCISAIIYLFIYFIPALLWFIRKIVTHPYFAVFPQMSCGKNQTAFLMTFFKQWDLSCRTSIKPRFVECIIDSFTVNRFLRLNYGSHFSIVTKGFWDVSLIKLFLPIVERHDLVDVPLCHTFSIVPWLI